MPEIMTYAKSKKKEDDFTSQLAEPEMIDPASRLHLSHEQIQHLVASHSRVFSDFREIAEPIFDAMLEGESVFSRRPNVSLRLPVSGGLAARVLVRPGWDRRRKEIRSGMTAEMVIERVATAGIRCNIPLPHVEVAVEMSDKGPRWTLWTHDDGESALHLMVGTMAEFVEDPERVFARSSDRCCLCGRRLTDEVSRGRGIGPECIQKYHLAYTPSFC
jgi:hypothetical protein